MPIKSSGGSVTVTSDWTRLLGQVDIQRIRGTTLSTGILKAVISAVAAGDNTIIAASAGVKHKIVKLIFIVAGTVSVILKSGANAMSGAMPFINTGGLGFDGDFYPLECGTNEAFIINLSAAVGVYGFAIYVDEA